VHGIPPSLLDITEINRRVRVARATGLSTIAPLAAENFTETVFFPYNSAARYAEHRELFLSGLRRAAGEAT